MPHSVATAQIFVGPKPERGVSTMEKDYDMLEEQDVSVEAASPEDVLITEKPAKPLAICRHCGKLFEYNPPTQGGVFCSMACRKAGHSELIRDSYTPELRKKRSEAAKKQWADPEKRIQAGEAIKEALSKRTPEQKQESIAKQLATKQERYGVPEYRKIGLEAHGTICQRCGQDFSNDLSKLVVHHIDGEHYMDEITDNSPENLMVLCQSCHAKLHGEMRRQTSKFTGNKHFEKAAFEILKGLQELGFKLDYENFHGTPKRFARAYCEIFDGCIATEARISEILSTTFPANGDDTMVVATDIVCFSMCPHHLLPVEYHVCVGYIPDKNGEVLGISKLARLVDLLARRPALQESFTQQIVDALAGIGVQGAAALVEGQHMCMRMRGAQATHTTITTTAISGIFREDPNTKSEFLQAISSRLRFAK